MTTIEYNLEIKRLLTSDLKTKIYQIPLCLYKYKLNVKLLINNY